MASSEDTQKSASAENLLLLLVHFDLDSSSLEEAYFMWEQGVDTYVCQSAVGAIKPSALKLVTVPNIFLGTNMH